MAWTSTLGASWGEDAEVQYSYPATPEWSLCPERGWVQEGSPDLSVTLAQNLVSATQSQGWACQSLVLKGEGVGLPLQGAGGKRE